MTEDQHTEDRYPFPWVMPDEREGIGDHLVIDLTGATCHTDRAAHCPACGGRPMQVIAVSGGDRYRHCSDCGRLWGIHDDDSVELVVDVEVRSGEN